MSGIWRTVMVTRRRPLSGPPAPDLGDLGSPKLHGMQGVKARIGLAVPDLPRALRALGNDAVVAGTGSPTRFGLVTCCQR